MCRLVKERGGGGLGGGSLLPKRFCPPPTAYLPFCSHQIFRSPLRPPENASKTMSEKPLQPLPRSKARVQGSQGPGPAAGACRWAVLRSGSPLSQMAAIGSAPVRQCGGSGGGIPGRVGLGSR